MKKLPVFLTAVLSFFVLLGASPLWGSFINTEELDYYVLNDLRTCAITYTNEAGEEHVGSGFQSDVVFRNGKWRPVITASTADFLKDGKTWWAKEVAFGYNYLKSSSSDHYGVLATEHLGTVVENSGVYNTGVSLILAEDYPTYSGILPWAKPEDLAGVTYGEWGGYGLVGDLDGSFLGELGYGLSFYLNFVTPATYGLPEGMIAGKWNDPLREGAIYLGDGGSPIILELLDNDDYVFGAAYGFALAPLTDDYLTVGDLSIGVSLTDPRLHALKRAALEEWGSSVPVPNSFLLLASGLLGVLVMTRRTT
jgi:hypothetical protein